VEAKLPASKLCSDAVGSASSTTKPFPATASAARATSVSQLDVYVRGSSRRSALSIASSTTSPAGS